MISQNSGPRIHTRRFALSLPLLLLVCLLLSAATRAEDVSAPSTATELEWLSGHWRGELPSGAIVEETWSDAQGGVLMGSFRWIQEDRVRLYEMLTVEQIDGALALRLRHFDEGLVAWEEKDAPMHFKLVAAASEEATFEHARAEKLTRLHYRRVDAERLEVVLETREGDQVSTQVFPYELVCALGED